MEKSLGTKSHVLIIESFAVIFDGSDTKDLDSINLTEMECCVLFFTLLSR